MAFTVEDGTGLTDANAYMTEAEWVSHHVDRGLATATDGTYSSLEIQAAIVQATDYIDKRFGQRFKGQRRTQDQALQWPRTDVWDDSGYTLPLMPNQLLAACAEYALVQLETGLSLTPIPDGSSGVVQEKTEKVGPITETLKYADRPMSSTGNTTQSLLEYPSADLWMEVLIVNPLSQEFYRG